MLLFAYYTIRETHGFLCHHGINRAEIPSIVLAIGIHTGNNNYYGIVVVSKEAQQNHHNIVLLILLLLWDRNAIMVVALVEKK